MKLQFNTNTILLILVILLLSAEAYHTAQVEKLDSKQFEVLNTKLNLILESEAETIKSRFK